MTHTVDIAFGIFIGLDGYMLEISILFDLCIGIFTPPFGGAGMLYQFVEYPVLNRFCLSGIQIDLFLSGTE